MYHVVDRVRDRRRLAPCCLLATASRFTFKLVSLPAVPVLRYHSLIDTMLSTASRRPGELGEVGELTRRMTGVVIDETTYSSADGSVRCSVSLVSHTMSAVVDLVAEVKLTMPVPKNENESVFVSIPLVGISVKLVRSVKNKATVAICMEVNDMILKGKWYTDRFELVGTDQWPLLHHRATQAEVDHFVLETIDPVRNELHGFDLPPVENEDSDVYKLVMNIYQPGTRSLSARLPRA